MSAHVHAVRLVGNVTNYGAFVSEDNANWRPPIHCARCGQAPQAIYEVELSNGETVPLGVSCAAKLLNVTPWKVNSWRPRHGALEAVR